MENKWHPINVRWETWVPTFLGFSAVWKASWEVSVGALVWLLGLATCPAGVSPTAQLQHRKIKYFTVAKPHTLRLLSEPSSILQLTFFIWSFLISRKWQHSIVFMAFHSLSVECVQSWAVEKKGPTARLILLGGESLGNFEAPWVPSKPDCILKSRKI